MVRGNSSAWVKFQTERLWSEDPRVHRFECGAYPERHICLAQHVALQLDARGDFDNRQAFRLEAEDAPFRNIQHLLLLLQCPASAKGHMLNLANKLSIFTFLRDLQPALFHPQLQAPRGEIAAEKDLAGGR